MRIAGGNSKAFTLIEVVISGALMSLILVSSYLCFSAAISAQKLIEPRVDVLQTARVAMALISADLRAACPLSKEFEFLGMHRSLGDVQADNLDFATHNFTPRREAEGDFCEMSYFLENDPASKQFVLWRRRNPTLALDPLSGGTREEIARGLRGVKFEYYDGLEWYENWGEVDGKGRSENSLRYRGNLAGMPDAVRITLWFDSTLPARNQETPGPNETRPAPPLVFQTVVRLNLAASSRSTSEGSSANSGSDNPGQSPAANSVPGPGP